MKAKHILQVVAFAALVPGAAFASLPSGYKQLSYVDTDGRQWVNTLFVPSCTNAVEIKAAVPASENAAQCLYCSRKQAGGSDTDKRTYSLMVLPNNISRFDYRNTHVHNSETYAGYGFAGDVAFEFCVNPDTDNRNVAFTIDGKPAAPSLTDAAADSFTPESNAYFCLFGAYTGALNDNTSVGSLATCRFYHFKVWDTKNRGDLLCHIIPVYGAAEDAIGFYDLVADRFLPVHGSALSAGNDVSSDMSLTADEDWRGDISMLANGVTVDLAGHNLMAANVWTASPVTNAVSAVAGGGYQDLAFITATGAQAIQINGFPLPGTATVETKFRPASVDTLQFLFSSRSGSQDNAYSALITTGSKIRFDFNAAQTTGNTELSSGYDYTAVFDGTTSKPTWSVNGTGEKAHTATSNNFTGGNDLCLFEGDANSSQYLFSGRLYYFTVTTNGVTALDLRPVCRLSDRASGLYDTVRGTFYPSGTATAFPFPTAPKFTNTSETASELRVGQELIPGYTVVDCITSTGAQYIDTGYVPVSTDRFEMKTSYSQNTGIPFFFCSRTNGSAQDQIAVLLANTGLRFDFCSTQHKSTTIPQQEEPFTIAIDGNAKKAYVSGTEVYEYSRNDFAPTRNLIIFANNTYTSSPTGSIYFFKVTGADGMLKLDMVPVKRSDGVAGLYDRVNRKFHPSSSETAFTAGTQAGDGRLYVDADTVFDAAEIDGNVTLVKNGESAFNGGGTTLAATLKPVAGTVGGITLAYGATLDLSEIPGSFDLNSNNLAFADGATIHILTGSRTLDRNTPVMSWTTGPENIGGLKFKTVLDGRERTMLVKSDGIYLPPYGFIIVIK